MATLASDQGCGGGRAWPGWHACSLPRVCPREQCGPVETLSHAEVPGALLHPPSSPAMREGWGGTSWAVRCPALLLGGSRCSKGADQGDLTGPACARNLLPGSAPCAGACELVRPERAVSVRPGCLCVPWGRKAVLKSADPGAAPLARAVGAVTGAGGLQGPLGRGPGDELLSTQGSRGLALPTLPVAAGNLNGGGSRSPSVA